MGARMSEDHFELNESWGKATPEETTDPRLGTPSEGPMDTPKPKVEPSPKAPSKQKDKPSPKRNHHHHAPKKKEPDPDEHPIDNNKDQEGKGEARYRSNIDYTLSLTHALLVPISKGEAFSIPSEHETHAFVQRLKEQGLIEKSE